MFLTNSSFSQTTVSLTATADAGIWNNNASDELINYGSCNILYINGPSGTAKDRSLIKFDLSSIPAKATITSAAIRLIKIGGSTTARNMSINRLTADWTEGTGSCTGSTGVCSWQQRIASTNWTTPGGDFDGTATATLSVAANGTYDFSATSLVQGWVSGTLPNYGVIFKFSTENLNSEIQFGATENATAGNRPQLIITYTVPTLSTTVTNVTCPSGSNTGAIDLTVTGGTTPYTYLWNNGATTQDLSAISIGTYSVTVTDKLGATVTSSVNVTNLDADCDGVPNTADLDDDNDGILDANEGYVNNICTADNLWSYKYYEGWHNVSLNGIESNLQFTDVGWSSPNASGLMTRVGPMSTPLHQGTTANDGVALYEVSANPPAGSGYAGASDTWELKMSMVRTPGTTQSLTFGNGSKFDRWYIVANDNQGNILATVPDYFSDVANTKTMSFTVPSDGVINITAYVLDPGAAHDIVKLNTVVSFCSTLQSSQIDTDNDGIPNHLDTDSDGDGCADAIEGGGLFTATSIDANGRLTGGVNANGVPTVATASGQTVGSSANAAVKDAYCIPLSGSITSQTNVSCFGTFTGTVTVVGTGGVPPYTYKLDNGAWGNSGSFIGIGAGLHTVLVRDVNLITTTVNISISQPTSALTAIAVALQPQCFAFGSISLNVSGGTAPYTYDWSDVAGNINPKDRSGLLGSSYSVVVTDANGCTTTTNATLTAPTGCSPINICRSSTNYTFSVAPDPNNTSYIWTVPSGAVIVSGQGTYQIVVNMTGVTPNTYQVCVTANNSCGTSAQTCQEINVISPVASATANSVCAGGNLQLFASGGTSYTWTGSAGFSSVSANPTILNATAINSGTYTVTATDLYGCNATASVNVTVSPSPSASTAVTNSNCGSTNGVVNTTISGGTSPYTFLWNNGLSTQNISGLTPGVYTLSVTDANGCKTTASGTVAATNGPIITNTSINILCSGASTGSISTTVTGGTSPYSYNWSNGASSANISNLSEGTYILTVVDASGCSNQKIVTITQPNSLQIDYTKTDVKCFGQSTGSINLISSGGTGSYTYSWTKNGIAIVNTTATITSQGAGVYVATVRDANNCTATQSITITQPNASLSATPTITNLKCNGNSDGQIVLTVTGGTSPYTFAWSGPSGYTATTKDISGRLAGTYNVTITDANNCTFTLNNLTITAPSTLVLGTPTVNNVNCFGGNNGSISLNISGGTSPYTFLWSNGATTNNLTGLAVGSYTLTVTDANSCKITSTAIVVSQPTAVLSAVASSTNPSCIGTNTGSINLSVSGGTSPFTFVWSNGSTAQSPTGLAAGIYTVTVTDAKGCTTQSNANLTNPSEIMVNATVTNVLCNGGNTGAISHTASGGVGVLTFLWADGPTLQNRTGLASGTYTVTVSDANGCTSIKSYVITQNSLIVASMSNTNISCFGSSNGSINLTVSGGIAPYTYTWSNGQTTEDISGLVTNTYTVSVKDVNNCTITMTSAPITQPSQLTVLANRVNNVTCKNGSNGSATAVVTGGTSPYNYSWSNGATIQSPTGLSAGIYNVSVSDAAGCVAQDTVQISEPIKPISLFSTTIETSACGGNTGSISLVIQDGTSPYNFGWTGPTSIGNVQSPSNLTTGTYNVTVTDALGCSGNLSVTVGQAPVLSVNIVVENANCVGNTGTATASVSGGTEPYSYLWTPGNLTTQLRSISTSGIYSVIITDAKGCTANASTTVSFNPLPSAILSNQTICEGQSATLAPTNLSNVNSFVWSIDDIETGNTTASITVSPSVNTVYSLTITSSVGCSAILEALVSVASNPIVSASGSTVCAGQTINLTSTSSSITQELVINGDFSDGNIGFSSDYIFGSNYAVTSNSNSTWNSFPSCTGYGGSGNMLIGNGNTNSSSKVWYQTINVTAGITYNLSFYAFDFFGGALAAKLQWGVNGVKIGPITNLITGGCNTWQQLSTTWTATISGAVVFAIYNNEISTTSNDFGIDNISITKPSTYSWTGPNSFTSNIQNPTISNTSASTAGVYTVSVTSTGGCTVTATTNVVVNLSPNAPIVTNASRCDIGTISLTASGCSNGTIQWYASQTSTTLLATGTTFSISSLSNSTVYFASCTNQNNCVSNTRNYGIAEIKPIPVTSAIAVNPTCLASTSLNNGKILLTNFKDNDIFTWNTGLTYNSSTASPAVIIPLNGEVRTSLTAPASFTIRVTNTANCFVDLPVSISNQCLPCPSNYCEPPIVFKTKF